MSLFSRFTTTWYTPAEVAKALKVGEVDIDTLIEKGELEAVTVGNVQRISRQTLSSFQQHNSSRRRAKKTWFKVAAISAGIGALLLATSVIRAQTAAVEDPTLIPYQGYLEYDGAPAEGPTRVVFTLENEAGESLGWTETHDVTAHAGRFSAQLGANPSNPIEAFLGLGALYIRISVQTLDSSWQPVGDLVELEGRQLLSSVPYALRGAPGKGFVVDGEANVGYARIRPQDGTSEGGEILLEGAGANNGWVIDTFGGALRLHSDEQVAFSVSQSGGQVSGTIEAEAVISTNNVALGAEVTAGDFSNTLPSNLDLATDGDESTATTEGITENTGNVGYFHFDFEAIKKGLLFMKLGLRMQTVNSCRWQLQMSSDGVNYTSILDNPFTGDQDEEIVTVAVPFWGRYAGVAAVDTGGGQAAMRVYEVVLKEYE